MTRKELVSDLEDMMELPKGTLKDDAPLSSFLQWNSMQMMGFIALVEQKTKYVVDGSQVVKATTVDDLLALLDGHLDA